MTRKRSKSGARSAVGSEIESLEHKAVLLDALPGCVFLIGPDHTVLDVNAAVEAMVEDTSLNVIGQPLESVMRKLVDGDGEPLDVDGPIDRCVATQEAQLLEAWLKPSAQDVAQDQSESKSVTVTVLPVSSPGHTDKAAVVVDGDAVRQPYALRDAVLSMVSHELRTPLLHIKGFVSTLLESDIQWDEETRLDFLHTIDREADRLTSMVNDLMEITRMGSVDLPLHLEDTDPYLLSYAAIDSASLFVSKHRVLVDVAEDMPKIRMDVLRVMGVLANLLQNASKYSEPGSKIVIDAELGDTEITFSVTDEGSGVPTDSQESIFNMFFRGENAVKSSSGSGLGLAVCKSVIDAHGGRIWVESEAGEGSIFKFTIPLKLGRRRVAQRAAGREAERSLRNGKTGSSKVASAKKSKEKSPAAADGNRRKGKVAITP